MFNISKETEIKGLEKQAIQKVIFNVVYTKGRGTMNPSILISENMYQKARFYYAHAMAILH